VNGSNFDLILLLVLGLLGFGMRRFAIPVLPLIVGVILGPRVELQGRRAMQLSSGDPKGLIGSVDVATGQFVVSGIAVVVYAIILIVLFWPLLFKLIKRLLPARAESVVEHLADELHHDLDTDIDGRPIATAHPEQIRLPASVQGSTPIADDPPPRSPASPAGTSRPDPEPPKELR
jgi:hypothetical protein